VQRVQGLWFARQEVEGQGRDAHGEVARSREFDYQFVATLG
jgi:hypothetical protein